MRFGRTLVWSHIICAARSLPIGQLYTKSSSDSSNNTLTVASAGGGNGPDNVVVTLRDGVNMISHLQWVESYFVANGGALIPGLPRAPSPGSPASPGKPAPAPTPAPGGADGSPALDLPDPGESDPDFGGGPKPAPGNTTPFPGFTNDAAGAAVLSVFPGVGYAGYLPLSVVEVLLSNPDVLSVEADVGGEIAVMDPDYAANWDTAEAVNATIDPSTRALPSPIGTGPAPLVTQSGAPWHLARLGNRHIPPALNATRFVYNGTAGRGVNVHILDTGIRVDHIEFGGRAKMVWAAPGFLLKDENGHGTHVAALAAGSTYGVAKSANVLGYRIATAGGSVSASNVMAGIFQVLKYARHRNDSSVINLSLTMPAHGGVDAMVQRAYKRGVHVVVAAGNQAKDVREFSPAGSPYAIAVGASMQDDARALFSNTGGLNVFAPGYRITSANYANPTGSSVLSGTSMASPLVAGTLAVVLGMHGPQTPDTMANWLSYSATPGVLQRLTSTDTNALLFNCWNERGSNSAVPCWDFVTRPDTKAGAKAAE